MDCEKELSEMLPLNRRIKCKLKEWLRRFLPAEIGGTIMAMFASYITYFYTGNKVFAAYAGTLGNNIGFYAPVILHDSNILRKKLEKEHKKFTFWAFLHLLKKMLLEFGPAEILDSFFIRPFFLFIFPVLLKNYPVGILVGKIVADVVFYIPVIISQELQIMHAKRSK